jgi:exosortase
MEWDIFDVAILAAMTMMFVPTFYRLATMGWRVADYTHAYFILPITLWLIWRQRAGLKKADRFTNSGIWLFVFGVLCYIYGAKNEFMFIEATSFVITMWAVFLLRFTWNSVKKIIFPLVYLVFLIPPPGIVIDMFTLPLKKISTYGAYFLLGSFHLPVQVYGSILNVGGNELFIADACSGFRSIVTLLALGAVYAYFQKVVLWKKWVIFLSVIPVALIGNILRIALAGYMSDLLGEKIAMGFFHEFSGIVLFAFTALTLAFISGYIGRDENEI